MINILVTGANGQLGREIRTLAPTFPLFNFYFASREELDLGNKQKMLGLFRRSGFNYCINCAAYTAVDRAESEAELTHEINVTGTKNLAECCALLNVILLHFSSDYVYHNAKNYPILETDFTQPQGVYAKTKLESETVAAQAQPQTMILRTSWVYSSFGNNFVKTMLRLSKEKSEINVVFDQIGAPTYARDIGLFVLTLLQKVEKGEVNKDELYSVFNYCNSGVASWFDVAQAVFYFKKITCAVRPIRSGAYPTAASRPPFSVLDTTKIRLTFGIDIPYWRDSLEKCLQLL